MNCLPYLGTLHLEHCSQDDIHWWSTLCLYFLHLPSANSLISPVNSSHTRYPRYLWPYTPLGTGHRPGRWGRWKCRSYLPYARILADQCPCLYHRQSWLELIPSDLWKTPRGDNSSIEIVTRINVTYHVNSSSQPIYKYYMAECVTFCLQCIVYTKTIFVPQDNLTDNFWFLTCHGLFLPGTSLNLVQNLTKVACHCNR